MEFQLVFIHENQQLKSNINEMFENGCNGMVGPMLLGILRIPV